MAISKEVQAQRSSEGAHSLEVRLEALREFLSKGVSRSSSLFKAHNMGISEISYRWSMEAEAAFQRWKECMEILPTVAALAKGEILFLHLATPFDGVSAILLAERRKVQIPIYFASRVLQGIERSYVESERLILALDHPIRVLTDKPIEWAFLKPDRSRRMAKWAMQLEEYNIEYEMDKLVESQAHVSPELSQSSVSCNKGTFRAKRGGKPHFGNSKKRITLPNPKEDKCLLEPSFKSEVEQQASTE
ncbi:reverse transcriptase domain-containing protein [Artemisia annua]|uniref:Reverse transcriptase domain-containing protein n=1 Tax=Artemisia annua TaxID=35608 RepID=A0A2U1NGX1_ARTAN|nr:reverse transcriptase domain-containing protein [Artemisia annua]